jgi:hypothetical protein
MKFIRYPVCFILIVMLLAGCLPTSVRSEQPTPVLSVVAANTPMPLTPTPLPSPSPLPSATPTVTPTATPGVVDLSLATLRIEDLPDGFEVLDDASQSQLGLKPDLLAQMFEGTFHQAKPVSSFAFHNAKTNTFEIVIGVVFYPLTDVEQAQLDKILAVPDTVMNNFSQGFNGKAQLIVGLRLVGNKSVGWAFTNTSGQTTLQGEMMMFRRENAAALMMTLSVAGQKPGASIATMAPLLDQRIKTGLGY